MVPPLRYSHLPNNQDDDQNCSCIYRLDEHLHGRLSFFRLRDQAAGLKYARVRFSECLRAP